MIADDIVAGLFRQGGNLAPIMARSHCVYVPFGIHGCDPKLEALLPTKKPNRWPIWAPWARPPYPSLVIVGDGPVSFTAADYEIDGKPFGPSSPELIASIQAGISETRNTEAVVVLELPSENFVEVETGARLLWVVFAIKLALRNDGVVVPSQWGFIGGMEDGQIIAVVQGEEAWRRRSYALFRHLLGISVDGMLHDTVKTSFGPLALGEEMALGRLLHVVGTTFALMNCKNIKLAPTQPPRQARRAAERSGRPKPYVVHHLHVGQISRQSGGSGGGDGPSLALHWVRGHFKTYTAERPLLGRAAGTFWWTPHLAGDVREGVVVKDYTLEA